MEKGFVIAIDGPAASGKGTIVQLLTAELDGANLYTGGLYRALALACLREGVKGEDIQSVLAVLQKITVSLGDEKSLGIQATVFLDGEDVTSTIRTPEVAIGAGKVAQIPKVREILISLQQRMVRSLVAQGKTVILDGQDTGTYVYPEAEAKIFLTASQEVRAKRRQKQYAKEGLEKSFEEMLEEIKMRDSRDFSREANPLSLHPEENGYFVVDSTDLDEYQTKELIMKELERKHLV
jgi:cytidylate kinase